MTIIVIGGGWSGLTAAVKLCQQGQSVLLVEAAKQLGGRARSVAWNQRTIDNGQHMMIGGYTTMLDLLKLVGGERSNLFTAHDLDVTVLDPVYPALTLRAGKILPWKISLLWHIAKDNGLSILWQLIRLQLSIRVCLKSPDHSVLYWLEQQGQSQRLIRQLWEPLCLATLNTPIAEASAHVFATVLKDLFKSKASAQLLVPKQPLKNIFPDLAANYIQQHGGSVKLQTRIKSLLIDNQCIRGIVTAQGETIYADQVIIATSPHHANQLYPAANVLTDSNPITTVYLSYPHQVTLPAPVIGLSGTAAQWVFDRQTEETGLLAIVISGPGDHTLLDNSRLVQVVTDELKKLLSITTQPTASLVIREKRATFHCDVDIQQRRPNTQTDIKGLWLTGDYLQNAYPATLEGAMMSGIESATQLMDQSSR